MSLSKQENLNISNSSGSQEPFNPLGDKKPSRRTPPKKKPPSRFKDGDPLLSIKGACEYLGLSDPVIRGYIKSGILKPIPMPGLVLTQAVAKYLFRRSDLDKLVDNAARGSYAG